MTLAVYYRTPRPPLKRQPGGRIAANAKERNNQEGTGAARRSPPGCFGGRAAARGEGPDENSQIIHSRDTKRIQTDSSISATIRM